MGSTHHGLGAGRRPLMHRLAATSDGPTEPTCGEGPAVRSAGPGGRAAVPGRSPSSRKPSRGYQPMMFTARATTSTMAATETADWSIIMVFAQRVSGVTSLAAKEMALLNDR